VGGGAVGGRRFDADLLLVSGGWNPVVHLHSQAGGRPVWDEGLAAFVPGACRQAVEAAGAARGVTGLARCLEDGARAGLRAVGARAGADAPRLPAAEPEEEPARPLALFVVPGAREPRAAADS
jgi:sarcosine oxidase, subunit alpha